MTSVSHIITSVNDLLDETLGGHWLQLVSGRCGVFMDVLFLSGRYDLFYMIKNKLVFFAVIK